MASKDLRPNTRLGQIASAAGQDHHLDVALCWSCGGGLYAAYRYTGTTEVEVAVARVRRGDFIISVRTRGDIKSARSTILKAPQVPGLRIVHLAENGSPVKKGEVVVEFDAVQQEQNVIARTTSVRAADGNIEQMKATQKMDDEADSMTKMQSEYDVERAKLDASKAEVLSAIDGEKNRIQVGVTEGQLQQVKSSINAHQVGHEADLSRLGQAKDKAVRDLGPGPKLPHQDAASGAQRRARQRAAEFPVAAAPSARRRRPSRKATTSGPAPRSPKFPTFPRCTSISAWTRWTAASCKWGSRSGSVWMPSPTRNSPPRSTGSARSRRWCSAADPPPKRLSRRAPR